MMKLIFLALAIASVAGQYCIPNAEPDPSGPDGGCRCKPGYIGNPDLCCYSPVRDQGCYVAGDPVLTSFSGNKVGLDFPCGTMISSSQVNAQMCVVNVFASGREMSTGAIYTSQVKVQLRQFSVVTLTFNFDATPFQVHYQTQVSEDFTMADGQTKTMNPSGITSALTLSYHAFSSLFIVNVAGIKIHVRPSFGGNAVQANSPGVCIMEPRESMTPNPGSTYACSLNEDITSKPVGEYLEFAIQPMKNYLYNTGILKQTTSSQYADMCQQYQDTMVDECEAADRYNAMKKCAFILFHPVIRRCFNAAGTGSRQVMGAFLSCLNTYCQGTKELCDGLKANKEFQSCAGNLMDCNTWTPYRRVNAFVAGEGDNENFAGEDDNLNQNEETTWSPLLNGILGDNSDQSNGNAGGVDDDFDPDNFF